MIFKLRILRKRWSTKHKIPKIAIFRFFAVLNMKMDLNEWKSSSKTPCARTLFDPKKSVNVKITRVSVTFTSVSVFILAEHYGKLFFTETYMI
jgi:hypothetical protein